MAIISSEDNPEKGYLAFFDLDGTLIAANSGKAMVRQAYDKGIMSWNDLIKAIYLSILYRLNLKDTLKIIDKMVGWVAGLPENTISELASEVAAKILIPSIHKEVLPEMNIHKENNAKVIILSSALKPVCLAVAKYLGMDDFLCSDLEVVDGHFTGLPLGPLCFGEEKAVRLKIYCEKNNTDLIDVWYYGDSIQDLPALSLVGYPVCINPDKKLAKAALKNGWRIYHWH